MVDLSKIEETEFDLRVKHPVTGEFIGLIITLSSMSSAPVERATQKITDKRQRLALRGKNFTAEEINEHEMALILAATRKWTWTDDATFEGATPEFNEGIGARLYSKLPFVKLQISEALNDNSNFFPH